MIKVCFVQLNGYSVFDQNSSAQIGGVEVQFGFLSRFLNKKLFKVSYIVGDWGQKKKEIHEDILFIRSFSLEKKILNFIKAPFLLFSALKTASADVYIMSSAGAETGLVTFYCKLFHKKIIYWTAHDIDCNGEYRKNNPVKGFLFEYGIKNVDLIVAQNSLHAKLLKEKFNYNAIVIRNGFPIIKKNAKKRIYILWVARCESWKNPKLFLKLAKLFPNYNFVMISTMQNQDQNLFYSIKKISDTIPNLKFIEGVAFSDIQKYFDRARIFVGTSKFEGFPITYLHACISGVPIISYKVNPDNFITDNRVGYCSKGEMNEFKKNINKLINDNSDWQEKSKNAYMYVYNKHDTKKIVKQWEKIIIKLIDQ
jgi:glycosyltransferase involved in cell wall biosynthesis